MTALWVLAALQAVLVAPAALAALVQDSRLQRRLNATKNASSAKI